MFTQEFYHMPMLLAWAVITMVAAKWPLGLGLAGLWTESLVCSLGCLLLRDLGL